jgi:arrestin-related trafficking adapter 3/6
MDSILPERVEYLTQMRRVARSDAPSRTTLLALKHPDASHGSQPILPLPEGLAHEFRRSPLAAVVDPAAVDVDELASAYMGPGPWEIDCALSLPDSCEHLHFTTKNRQSNVAISHALKIVFRVERGDDQFVDAKTGKRKLFDIVVQAPVHILSVSIAHGVSWTTRSADARPFPVPLRS